MDFNKIIEKLSWNELPPELFSSILAFIITLIIAIVIYIKSKNYNPLKKPSGFMNIVESVVSFTDRQVRQIMGPAFDGFGGYILFVGFYILLGFIIGWIGIPNFLQPGGATYLEPLPNPFTNLAFPLSLALCTFGLTHFNAIKYKKAEYLKRYIEPIPLFLPINLVTMWSPVLSYTLRIFGNALAGYCVITLIYVGLGTIFDGTLYGLMFTPVISPIAHLYFDVFDGLIQLAVFTILTMINIANEYVSPEEYERNEEEKRLKKEMKLKKKEAKKLKKESA